MLPHILFGAFFFNFINDSFVTIFIYLELSIMIFILIIHISKYSCYPGMKYFFIQTLSSILFICSFLFIYINTFVLLLSMFIKSGFWPFHVWLINLCSSLNWLSIFYLLRFQKFLPFYIIFSFHNLSSFFIFFFFFLSVNLLVGWLNCYRVVDSHSFLGYNSIVDQSWLAFGFMSRDYLAYIYIFVYTIFSYLIFINLDIYQIKNISHFGGDSSCSVNFGLSMLSVIGLPPTLGFFLKFIIVYYCICKSLLFSSFFFLVVKILRIFFFSRPLIACLNYWDQSVNYTIFSSLSKLSLINFCLNLFGFLLLFFILH